MHKKTKLLIIAVLLHLSFSNAHSGLLDFPKKNPMVSLGAATVGSIYLNTTLHKARHLSYNLPKVDSYFQVHPQDFNLVAQYVLWALHNPANKKDYDRYKKLAETMDLSGIPPYLPQKNNNSNILVNPQLEQNPSDYVLENPIQEQPFSNIIYSPQGQQIDTSTEFPIERPQSWEDFLLLKTNSQELADNMANAGMGQKPLGYAAHHLIPATDISAQKARSILNKYGIDINSELNGVYLPTPQDTTSTQGIEHNGRHPKIYAEKINKLIEIADTRGGQPEVLNELISIKNKLQNASRTSKWSNIL